MHRHLSITLAFLSSAAVYAQNVAPVQQDTQTHVSPGTSATSAAKASEAASAQKAGKPAPEDKPVVLDSVIAIINGDVLLQSDVEEERRFESLQLLPESEDNDVRAAQHLITRTLILQQMKAQDQTSPNITDADVAKLVAEVKKQQPGCAQAHCDTTAGWTKYLADRGMTPEEVNQRWRERLVILDYLNLRFRQGVRVPTDQVQSYYDKTLVPEFRAKHETPPPVKSLQPRIEEILLQEQVTKQIDEWEASLRQQGSVEILVPAYGQSNAHGQDQDNVPEGTL